MELEKYNRVRKRLKEHLDEALQNPKIHDWFMIAVNGSYNYNMDTPQSDIDSKLLVIPSLEQLVNGKSLNYLHCMSDNGEHVEVKDIRHYFATMLKQNINFVETLYAQVWIINPVYMRLFHYLFEMRDVISGCNPIATIHCIQGTAYQKYKQMLQSSPARATDIENYGFDRKSLHHLVRYVFFGEYYMEGTSYQECLQNNDVPNIRRMIMNLKTTTVLNREQAINIAEDMLNGFDKKVDSYLTTIKPFQKDFSALAAQVKDFLDTLAFEIIKQSIAKEYNG
jgi:predicted nucleotidyltransferase